uniref:Uncharacterized protein n=1 Tax=Chromera velia CCMP2878 TaxID=1169474 RepID=A0A0G4I5V7_9ALVE|eukprot:Cvel_88.t1-p1 / transcript=Cvel_88.t1 / gene=Cvel_88 / organism=Chromera_velia_CCMP2878 / gene_product=Protein SEC13 homolog, putative / transcript_product=Protein SEC13 homolog, putative / location=Cvel_scaffold6:269542-273344(+) / protein_length=352 / sequence_SO=supercontig / SO=protein_coding / is_pseudo=false
MAQTVASFDAAHGAPIHDAQLDFYGKRLATASADNSIRIWDVSTETPQFLCELLGHDGPVWQVAWAHPKFGNLLASCSYDKRVIVWKEARNGAFEPCYRHEEHQASVNSCAFAPAECGLHLVCGSSDGQVSVLSYRPESSGWESKSFEAHAAGVNAVGFSCPLGEGEAGLQNLNIVTGGCDTDVSVWKWGVQLHQWEPTNPRFPKGHEKWVRDVAWRPGSSSSTNMIASCAEDGMVILWSQDSPNSQWGPVHQEKLGEPVWRVSWSITGSLLAASFGDNQTVLFKEALNGSWEKVTDIDETGVKLPPPPPMGAGVGDGMGVPDGGMGGGMTGLGADSGAQYPSEADILSSFQ